MDIFKSKVKAIIKSLWRKDWPSQIRNCFLKVWQNIRVLYQYPSKGYIKVIVNYFYTVSVGATLVLFFEHEGEYGVKVFVGLLMVVSLFIACLLAKLVDKKGD